MKYVILFMEVTPNGHVTRCNTKRKGLRCRSDLLHGSKKKSTFEAAVRQLGQQIADDNGVDLAGGEVSDETPLSETAQKLLDGLKEIKRQLLLPR